MKIEIKTKADLIEFLKPFDDDIKIGQFLWNTNEYQSEIDVSYKNLVKKEHRSFYRQGNVADTDDESFIIFGVI